MGELIVRTYDFWSFEMYLHGDFPPPHIFAVPQFKRQICTTEKID
jgi:hypothetical protein